MEWTPDLTVGVELIDTQHKELFKRITDLLDSIKKKECKYTIDDTTKFLEEYVVFHFTDEENVMREAGYPELEAHMKLHAQFIDDFNELKDKLKHEISSYTRSVYTNQIVVDWILQHIKTVDMKFGGFMESRSS